MLLLGTLECYPLNQAQVWGDLDCSGEGTVECEATQGQCTSSSPHLMWGFIPTPEFWASTFLSLSFHEATKTAGLLCSCCLWICRCTHSGGKELWVPGSPPVPPCPHFGIETLKLPHFLVCSFRRELCLSVFCIGLDYRDGSHLKGKSRGSFLKAQFWPQSY